MASPTLDRYHSQMSFRRPISGPYRSSTNPQGDTMDWNFKPWPL
jgi:hypothetical protein